MVSEVTFPHKALLIIDMQMEMLYRVEEGIPTVNADAAQKIAQLQARFRGAGAHVIHVHHNELSSPDSNIRLDQPGGQPIAECAPQEGEAVFIKNGSSAFTGTGVEAYLRSEGISELVIVGAVAGYCVTSSVRMASDLGFDVIVASDAVMGYGVTAPDGAVHSPEQVLSVTLGLFDGEFARVMSSDSVTV